MRVRISFISVSPLTLAIAFVHAQITDPLPAPVEKRGLMVEIRDVVRLPDTRGLRPARSGREPGRLGARAVSSAICRTAAASPTTRADCSTCSTATTSRRCMRTSARRSRSPIYNRLESGFIGFDFPSGVREERALLHGARRARAWATRRRRTSSRRASPRRTSTYHNVITEWHATNPAANTFEGTRRELLSRRPHRHEPDAPVRRRRVQPDREARRARLRPALHERQRSSGSATAAARTRTIPSQTQRLDSVITAILRIRSAQSVGIQGHEGARRLHDSAGQQVRGRRRSEDARRDLRLRLPQRAPAVVGSHRRDDVRVATSG